MSFHEKSAWACLGSILVVFVPFFLVVFNTPGYPVVVAAFLASVVGLITLLTVLHAWFAIGSKSIRQTGDAPPMDEREVGIELRATKISSIVLGVVVMFWCLGAYGSIPFGGAEQVAEAPGVMLPVPADDALFAVHLLFAGFVVANVVYYLAQVIGHRRSV